MTAPSFAAQASAMQEVLFSHATKRVARTHSRSASAAFCAYAHVMALFPILAYTFACGRPRRQTARVAACYRTTLAYHLTRGRA